LYDGRIDFNSAVLNPLEPNWLDFAYDPGDGLHPNTAGQSRWLKASTSASSLLLKCK
jgi:lysophospholipase L1-like esterase